MQSSISDAYESLVVLHLRSAELNCESCDTAVEVKLGNSFTRKTRIVTKSKTPKYDETIKFLVRESERKFPLTLNILIRSLLFHQDLYGTAEVSVSELAMGTEHLLSLPIIKQNGLKNEVGGKLDVSIYVFDRNAMETNFWKQLLTAFDKDQNQSIDRDELSAMVYAIGATLSAEELEQLMQDVYGPEKTSLSIDEIASKLRNRSLKSFTSTRSKLLAPLAVRGASSSGLVSPPPKSPSPKHMSSLSASGTDKSKSPATSVSPATPVSPVSPTSPSPAAAAIAATGADNTGIVSILMTNSAVADDEDDEMLWRAQLLAKNSAQVRDLVTTQRDRLLEADKQTEKQRNASREPHKIIVQDRESGKLVEEKMPEWLKTSLRAMYSNSSGRFLVRGDKMKQLLRTMTENQRKKFVDPKSKKEIPDFIKFHNLNTAEILDPLDSFQNFNDFFIRKLKPEARPILAPDDLSIAVCPADCRLHVFASVDEATRLWIKGSHFTLAALLGSQQLAEEFAGCSVVIARLAPQDYHRYHSPVSGRVGEFRWFETGVYYTVNPIAVREDIDVFTSNKRTVVPIETQHFGKVMWVSVGATMVGSVNFTKATGEDIRKGEEFGFFAFGGSTVLILFRAGTIRFDKDLLLNSQKQMETLVKVGQSLGRSLHQQ